MWGFTLGCSAALMNCKYTCYEVQPARYNKYSKIRNRSTGFCTSRLHQPWWRSFIYWLFFSSNLSDVVWWHGGICFCEGTRLLILSMTLNNKNIYKGIAISLIQKQRLRLAHDNNFRRWKRWCVKVSETCVFCSSTWWLKCSAHSVFLFFFLWRLLLKV